METGTELYENNIRYRERKSLYAGYGYNISKERRFIISCAGKIKGSILEAGTGKGHLAMELAKKGHDVVSFDVDNEALKTAEMNLVFYGLDKKVKLEKQDGASLNFKDGEFDYIFCTNTLHHLEKPEIFINEIIRALKKGGLFILSDFTAVSFKIMDKIHRLDGHRHETTGWPMKKAKKYLLSKGFTVKENTDEYQVVYACERTGT